MKAWTKSPSQKTLTEGDTINELEPLLEVNTDKVDTEIPAPTTDDFLKIITQEGIAAKSASYWRS